MISNKYNKIIKKEEKKFSSKIKIYVEDPWNQFDLIGCLFFFIGMTLRFLALMDREDLFTAARLKIIYIYSFSCFFFDDSIYSIKQQKGSFYALIYAFGTCVYYSFLCGSQFSDLN